MWREATTIYMTAGHGGSSSPQAGAGAPGGAASGSSWYCPPAARCSSTAYATKTRRKVMRLVHEDFW
ncbi:peptidase C39 family protein [Pseudomonas aeruginosa]|nr:peptidase C39 family protein [Pseudomonas aeruginosa]